MTHATRDPQLPTGLTRLLAARSLVASVAVFSLVFGFSVVFGGVQPANAQSSKAKVAVAAAPASDRVAVKGALPEPEVVPAGSDIDAEDLDTRDKLPVTGGPAVVGVPGGAVPAAGAASAGGVPAGAVAASAATGGNPVSTADWKCPVVGGKFTNDWGQARSGGRRHEGTDMLAPRGTPIVAPLGGTVTFAESSLGGRSFYLKAANGLTLFGAHLAGYGQGGSVAAGTVIGFVGDSGNARGTPHLHFEIHPTKSTKMNPFPVLKSIC